jgi:hypothetical protein
MCEQFLLAGAETPAELSPASSALERSPPGANSYQALGAWTVPVN